MRTNGWKNVRVEFKISSFRIKYDIKIKIRLGVYLRLSYQGKSYTGRKG